MLDTLYLRSPFLQRIFSFRLLDATVVSCGSLTVAEELARRAGLEFESHDVTTKDGYKLTLHRCYLPKSRRDKEQSESISGRSNPVFLMHGLMQVKELNECLIF
jgi:hypothetical protein